MRYALFNLGLAIILGFGGIAYARQRQVIFDACRTALFVTFLALPWDAWAIQRGVWTYGDPGPFVLGLPLNDVVFIALSSFFSACVVGKALDSWKGEAEWRHDDGA